MQVFESAGTYTPPGDGDPNHWVVHMNSADLSLGTYSIPAGGLDDQTPHTEDEIYVVQAGRATLVTPSGTAAMSPHEIDWKWVKGHAGDPGNERADELARRGIEDATGVVQAR